MKDILDVLIYRLSDKGVEPFGVPRLIRDVLHTIGDGGEFTIGRINQNLAVLGWGDQVLDGYLFELILYLLETDGKYEVKQHTVH